MFPKSLKYRDYMELLMFRHEPGAIILSEKGTVSR